MADSAGIIPSKNPEKSKLSNSINRTTSETLRLTETDRVLNQPNSLSSSTPRKKTSFIITSITSRTSNDAGEDSADDLDESHTEDISEIVDNSRITDIENETPSYSEDTFSKDDVFFNASSSLVSAPVIPTSSQYGLALVPTSENSENTLNPSGVGDHSENPDLRVEVNESVINLGVVSTKHDPEMRDLHPPAPRTERFKVVKIESTEPFKRGRWICMDYLDHPNIAQNAAVNNTKSDSEISPHPPSEASDSISVTNSAASAQVTNFVDEQRQHQLQVNINNIINSEVSNQQQASNMQPSDNGQLVNNQQQSMPLSTPANIPTNYTTVSPGQSLQSNLQMSQPNIVNSASTAPPPQSQQQQQPSQQAPQSQSQSLSQVHMQQILANSNAHQSLQPQQIQQVLSGAAMAPQGQQAVQSQQQPSQQPQQQQMSSQPIQQQPQQQPMMQPQGMPQQMSSMPQYQPQPQTQPAMSQQPQYQPMQQQQPQMMQQQMPPQQSMQPQMTSVHMQPNVQQNMQQIPMQQQQNQQPQIMPQQLQQMPQQMAQQVAYSQPLGQNQPSVTQNSTQGMMQTMHPQMQNYQQNQMMSNMQPQPIMNMPGQPHLQQQYYTGNIPQTAAIINSQGGMMPSMSQAGTVGQVNMQGSANLPPLQSYPVSQQQIQQVPGMPQTPPVPNSMPQYTLPMSMAQPTMQMSQPLPSSVGMQQPISYSVPASQGYPQVSSVPSSSVDVRSVIAADHCQESIPAPTAALLESLAEVTATADDQPQGEDPESASGASAVAIDNKIEQAMDLVKSHLMFAVREEVEVLKEKIAELMERITQLESENSLLRASANPDTLAQLPPTQPSQTSNPP